MTKSKNSSSKFIRLIIFVAFVFVIVSLIIRHFSAFGNVLLVMVGFGAVVLVHEFGHFIIAKLTNIKVEAFSIFMPPILLGIKRTEEGIRFRILPEIFPKEDEGEDEGEKDKEIDESDQGALNFTIGKKGKDGETEYRIGLIPFGGFVKMLGQDDVGAAKNSDDPRSFANKPVHIRAAVIAAGVVFNVISAVIIFMIAFLIGINLPPAVVGGVIPNSPAALAGLKPGDEIIEIAGKSKDLDFSNIGIAAALSGKDEKVPIKVRHTDNSEQTYHLTATLIDDNPMRLFGILQAESLTVAQLNEKDANELYARTGLLPNDKIISVNGREVRGHWELMEILKESYVPEVTLTAERTNKDKSIEIIDTQISSLLNFISDPNSELDPNESQIYSIVPRLLVDSPFVVPDSIEEQPQNKGIKAKILSLFKRLGNKFRGKPEGSEIKESIPKPPLQTGDVIIAIGDVNDPTLKELREIVTEYENKELPVTVLRADSNGIENKTTVTVTPKKPKGSNRVLIGFTPVLDANHPVVADTIAVKNGPQKLEIPRGATITSVDGTPVSNYYDIIKEIKRYPGERITIDWRIDEKTAGNVAVNIDKDIRYICVQPIFPEIEIIPFKPLKRLYDADGPIEAIVMGFRRTASFITQTYVTLRRLIGGLVSPKNLMGPVGIMTISYQIVAEQPPVYYVYFLGLISAVIAVFNFLPVPPLDGGLILLLIIEKIKGSPISERVQTILAYTSWTLILALLIYVTFNDILRLFN